MPIRRASCLAFALFALQVTACSKTAKTVSWEEEVRLNTGETIWIKRSDQFETKSEPGNPLQSALWPGMRTYEFDWRGQHYVYTTTSKESLGALMLYVVGGSSLVVVDTTRACAKAGFAEFRWVEGGWQLQPNVSPELVGQPRNLMAHYAADGSISGRVTTDMKTAEDTAPRRARVALTLEAASVATDCSRRK